MEKHFCDRCGREIKEDGDLVFGNELCNDCCEQIDYFINNPDTIISNPKAETKDPCEGCTCFEAFNREDYTRCPNLLHTIDNITMQHMFHCNEKNATINFTVDEFINKGKTVTPRDFEEESE